MFLYHRSTDSPMQFPIDIISGYYLLPTLLSLAKQSIMLINANNEYVHVKCPNTVILLVARSFYLSV